MDPDPRPGYRHVYHNGSQPDSVERSPLARTPKPIYDDDPPRRFALCDIPRTDAVEDAETDENGTVYADLDGWCHYDVDPATIVGWGIEFNDLAMVCLRNSDPRQRIYGRFSSAEAARETYSRVAPLRLVYG